MAEKDVVTVNHGKVFGPANWYTHYCGECGKQVVRGVPCPCGTIPVWPAMNAERAREIAGQLYGDLIDHSSLDHYGEEAIKMITEEYNAIEAYEHERRYGGP